MNKAYWEILQSREYEDNEGVKFLHWYADDLSGELWKWLVGISFLGEKVDVCIFAPIPQRPVLLSTINCYWFLTETHFWQKQTQNTAVSVIYLQCSYQYFFFSFDYMWNLYNSAISETIFSKSKKSTRGPLQPLKSFWEEWIRNA